MTTRTLALFMVTIWACDNQVPSDSVDAGDTNADAGFPEVVLSTTMGDLVVELDEVNMPITSGNFLAYVDSGFYDGTIIHRVINDWVIQGGGYTSGLTPVSPGDPIELELSAERTHVDGCLSMARSADPDSATCQWFICDWPEEGEPPQADLDGNYAAFGVLIEGFDVLETISEVATTTVGLLEDLPVEEIVVTQAFRR